MARGDIEEAYRILGLDPGTEWGAIMTRYKRLVIVWHPDRVPGDKKWEEDANEELKKFNWARDVLKEHFKRGGHIEGGDCFCKQDGTGGSSSYSNKSKATGPGPSAKKKKPAGKKKKAAKRSSSEKDKAAEADEERKKRAEEEQQKKQAEQKHESDQAQSSESPSAEEQKTKGSKAHSDALASQKRRWQLAAILGITYFSLCLFGWIGTSTKKVASNFMKNSGFSKPKEEQRKNYKPKPKTHDPYYKFKAEPPPKPYVVIPQEPILTRQDKLDIGTLEGQYSTHASRVAKGKILEDMVFKLNRAMTRVDPSDTHLHKRIKAVEDRAALELRATQNQIEFVEKSIGKLEDKIVRKLSRKYLPAKPREVGSYTINSSGDYHNLEVSNPRLFE